MIAHRGDSGHRPENTLASFASALELGAELVELDVQLTRDGQMVVIHDVTLDRTTSGRGRVLDLTLKEVRAVSAGCPERFGTGYAGERVPILVEALAFLRGRARVLVELKSESVTGDLEGGLEALVVAEIRKAGMVGEVALLAVDTAVLVQMFTTSPRDHPRPPLLSRHTDGGGGRRARRRLRPRHAGEGRARRGDGP